MSLESVVILWMVGMGALSLVALAMRDKLRWDASIDDARKRVDAMLIEIETLNGEQRYEESLVVARKALAIAERRLAGEKGYSIAGWYLVGVTHVQLRNWQKALAGLERGHAIAREAPGHEWFVARSLEEMARCEASLGGAESAWELLDEAETVRRAWDPTTLTDNVEMRARVARMLGAFDVAVENYRELLAQLGGQREHGPYRETIRRVAVSITGGPTSYTAHAGLATALCAIGRAEESAAQLELAKAALRSELGDHHERQLRVLTQWARRQEACDLLTSAGELWLEVAEDPGADARRAVEALSAAAWCAWRRGDHEETAVLVERARHRDSAHELRALTVGGHARLAYHRRDLDEGERLMSELEGPMSDVLMITRACASYSVDPDRGIELAGVVADAAPPWGPLLAANFAFWRGLTELGEKWERPARAHLEREPEIMAATFLATTSADRLRVAGRFSEAEESLSEIDPPRGVPIFAAIHAMGAAQLALARGDVESALAKVSRAANEYPRSGDARTRLALLSTLMKARRAGDQDAVTSEIEEASAIAARLPADDPALVGFLVEQALQCLNSHRMGEALAAIERADSLQRTWYGSTGITQPALALAHARVLHALGRKDDALAALRRGTEAARTTYGPSHPVHFDLQELQATVEGSSAR